MDTRYFLYLSGLISEASEPEGKKEIKNYMFFNSLRSMKDKIDHLLKMDPHEIDSMLSDGHDWANDHVATSRDDIEEVFNWITGKR